MKVTLLTKPLSEAEFMVALDAILDAAWDENILGPNVNDDQFDRTCDRVLAKEGIDLGDGKRVRPQAEDCKALRTLAYEQVAAGCD